MSPKEFRKNTLELMEQGVLFAYQFPQVGGEMMFMEIPLDKDDTTLIPVSLKEVGLMFQEDEFREKAEFN